MLEKIERKPAISREDVREVMSSFPVFGGAGMVARGQTLPPSTRAVPQGDRRLRPPFVRTAACLPTRNIRGLSIQPSIVPHIQQLPRRQKRVPVQEPPDEDGGVSCHHLLQKLLQLGAMMPQSRNPPPRTSRSKTKTCPHCHHG